MIGVPVLVSSFNVEAGRWTNVSFQHQEIKTFFELIQEKVKTHVYLNWSFFAVCACERTSVFVCVCA